MATAEEIENLVKLLRWKPEYIFYNEITDHILVIRSGTPGLQIVRGIEDDFLYASGILKDLLNQFNIEPNDYSYVIVGEV